MKRKSNKQIAKKKNEFRYHKVELKKDNGRIIHIDHPSYVFLEKGNIYIYVTLTHSNNNKNVLVIKLRKNPNPKDKRDSYRVVGVNRDTKDRFGRRRKGWKIDKRDEEDIRKEYKQTKKDDSANQDQLDNSALEN